jgi:hypothetical protein
MSAFPHLFGAKCTHKITMVIASLTRVFSIKSDAEMAYTISFSSFHRNKVYLGSEVLTAVVMKSSIFWDIMPCRLPPAFTLVSCSAYSTLNMEAICSSETSVDFEIHGVIIEYSTLRGLLHSPKQKFTHKFPKRLEAVTASCFCFTTSVTTLGLKELNFLCGRVPCSIFYL